MTSQTVADMNNKRVVIEGVKPEIDSGRHPIKRVVGEHVIVEADVFTDGHEALSCELLYRPGNSGAWLAVPMDPLVNDRWRAEFTVTGLGKYSYTIHAWLDPFKLWSRNLVKRLEVGQDVTIELLIGANLIDDALRRTKDNDAASSPPTPTTPLGPQAASRSPLRRIRRPYASPRRPRGGITYDRELEVIVDPVRARFGAWYEFFPRSCWEDKCTHGTFKIAEPPPVHGVLGFDVVYLPPIHPIGNTTRKGKNNNVVAQPATSAAPGPSATSMAATSR